MSLEPEESKEKPKKTKKAKARDLALKYKDLPDHQIRAKIQEEIPCARSTASKAVTWFRRQETKEKAAKPSIKVVDEKKKEPEFIAETEEAEIEEIAEKPAAPPEEITPEEAQEQLNIFKDMNRGLHVILFAKDGLVDMLIKGGVEEKQAKDVADQLYRWMARRYSAEELEKFDTIFLFASYGTMIGTIVRNALKNRKKGEKTKK